MSTQDFAMEVDELYARLSCSLSALEIIWYAGSDIKSVSAQEAELRSDALYAVLLQLQALNGELGELTDKAMRLEAKA